MSYDGFVDAFGAPDPPAAPGLAFRRRTPTDMWEGAYGQIGAGWYRDGFVYLFGEGVAQLEKCLEAWRFVVPRKEKRMVLGWTAHGAILTLENEGEPDHERVWLLDPFSVTYAPVPNTRFLNLLGRALPGAEIGAIEDDTVYHAWLARNGVRRLEPNQILGFKIPRPLGGTKDCSNLQLEDITEYYRTTGPIYAEALSS